MIGLWSYVHTAANIWDDAFLKYEYPLKPAQRQNRIINLGWWIRTKVVFKQINDQQFEIWNKQRIWALTGRTQVRSLLATLTAV